MLLTHCEFTLTNGAEDYRVIWTANRNEWIVDIKFKEDTAFTGWYSFVKKLQPISKFIHPVPTIERSIELIGTVIELQNKTEKNQ